jgi:hypothetical protein
MGEYDVGYGKPPKGSRFKPGNNANPKGRPKRKPLAIAKTIADFVNQPVQYTENGRKRKATRQDLKIKKIVSDAVKGDVKSAEMMLKLLEFAKKHGGVGIQTIRIGNWLPDYPGQTAEQKTKEFRTNGEVGTLDWWKMAGNEPNEGGSQSEP